MSIDEPFIEEQSKQSPTLVPFKVISSPRRVDTPIRIGSKPVTLVQAPEITEYLDLETGEIIPAKQVHAAQGQPIDLSLRALQREHLLNSLREEVKEFAFYVLTFRNRRRGITPDIEKLVKWYAEATHRRTENVRRHLPKLKQAGILASEPCISVHPQQQTQQAKEIRQRDRPPCTKSESLGTVLAKTGSHTWGQSHGSSDCVLEIQHISCRQKTRLMMLRYCLPGSPLVFPRSNHQISTFSSLSETFTKNTETLFLLG